MLIGRRVHYHGNIDDGWGRCVVADEIDTDHGLRYELSTLHDGTVILHTVRRTSFTLIPLAGKHVVASAQLRAQIVQSEFARQWSRDHWLPEITEGVDTLPRRVADLIQHNRPVDAEYALLCGEQFVGCISYQQYHDRVTALVIAGDDDSRT